MRYYLVFGLICLALAGPLYLFLFNNTSWNPYVDWLLALSPTTFVVYGLDKLLSKIGRGRCPEILLNSMALLGGFPGGWAGTFLFNHKSNHQKHPVIWLCLALGTLGHAALAYYWFVK
jgi:uncharacterized membrane protein YsdA (DUF1294 family)